MMKPPHVFQVSLTVRHLWRFLQPSFFKGRSHLVNGWQVMTIELQPYITILSIWWSKSSISRIFPKIEPSSELGVPPWLWKPFAQAPLRVRTWCRRHGQSGRQGGSKSWSHREVPWNTDDQIEDGSVNLSGWWFGTSILFSQKYWVSNHPNWRSYFSEGWPNHQPAIYIILYRGPFSEIIHLPAIWRFSPILLLWNSLCVPDVGPRSEFSITKDAARRPPEDCVFLCVTVGDLLRSEQTINCNMDMMGYD